MDASHPPLRSRTRPPPRLLQAQGPTPPSDATSDPRSPLASRRSPRKRSSRGPTAVARSTLERRRGRVSRSGRSWTRWTGSRLQRRESRWAEDWGRALSPRYPGRGTGRIRTICWIGRWGGSSTPCRSVVPPFHPLSSVTFVLTLPFFLVLQVEIPIVPVVAGLESSESGKYWIGQPPKLCFCRILRSKTVMVRVGGGWVELSK